MQRLRIEHVQKREKRLVDAVITAELEKLGPVYVKALASLRTIASVMFAGLTHTGAYRKDRLLAELPRPLGLDTCNKAIPDEVFDVSVRSEHEQFFDDIAARLAANPNTKIEI